MPSVSDNSVSVAALLDMADEMIYYRECVPYSGEPIAREATMVVGRAIEHRAMLWWPDKAEKA